MLDLGRCFAPAFLGLASAFVLSTGVLDPPHQAAGPVRVQLVTGGHSYDLSFYSVFDDLPDVRITVNPHPSAYRTDLAARYDVLVLYDMTDVTSETERRHLRQFLEAGRGLVVLHHALANNQQWPWWYEEVVGGRYLLEPDGDLPASTYNVNVEFRVRRVREHPVTTDISDFTLRDETYGGVWLTPGIEVLLETDEPGSMRPIAWISPYPHSRVVYIQPGHGPEAHRHASYRRLVHNAIVWAAGRSGR